MVTECLTYLDKMPNFYEVYCRIRDKRLMIPEGICYREWEMLYTIAGRHFNLPGRVKCMRIYTAYSDVVREMILEGHEVEIGYLGRMVVLENDNTLSTLHRFKRSRRDGTKTNVFPTFISCLPDVTGRVNNSILKAVKELRKLELLSYKNSKEDSSAVYCTAIDRFLKGNIMTRHDLQTNVNKKTNK